MWSGEASLGPEGADRAGEPAPPAVGAGSGAARPRRVPRSPSGFLPSHALLGLAARPRAELRPRWSVVGRCPVPGPRGLRVRAPTRGGPGTGSSPGRSQGARRLRLENNRRKKRPKVLSVHETPTPSGTAGGRMCKHPAPSTLQIGKAPPSSSPVVVGGPDAASAFRRALPSPQPTRARQGFARIARGKASRWRTRTQSACGATFCTGRGRPPGWHPNAPCVGGHRADGSPARDSAAPRRARPQGTEGGASGATRRPGRGVPRRSPGEVGLLSGRCASAVPADGCYRPVLEPPTCAGGRCGLAVPSAPTGGRCGEGVPGSPAQVSAAPVPTRSFSGASRGRRPGAAGRRGLGRCPGCLDPSYASALSAGKDICPPAGHSPSDSRNQNPGAAGRRRRKKSRRRPPRPQVQVGTRRPRPPGQDIGPGLRRGAGRRVSDWRKAAPLANPTPRGRPGDDGGGRRRPWRAPVGAGRHALPLPLPCFFSPFLSVPLTVTTRLLTARSVTHRRCFLSSQNVLPERL